MILADINAFWKIIFILLLIIIGLRLVFKFFGKNIIRFILRRLSKKAERHFREQTTGNKTDKTGKTTIDKQPSQQRQSNKNVGEYIDYEEID